MIGGGYGQFRISGMTARRFKGIEGVNRGDIVQQVPVHMDHVASVFEVTHHMAVPDFVKQSACCHGPDLRPLRKALTITAIVMATKARAMG